MKTKTQKLLVTVTTLTLAASTFTGCANERKNDLRSAPESSELHDHDHDTTAQSGHQHAGGTAESAYGAISLALDSSGGGKITQLDYDSRDSEWEIIVINHDLEYELVTDAQGKRIIKKDRGERADLDSIHKAEIATVEAKSAIETALDRTPGLILEADLELERGTQPFWKITIQPEGSQTTTRLLIDATNGQVL